MIQIHNDGMFYLGGKLIPEGQEELLRPGVFVEATGELAANPAIFDLEKGVPQEEEGHE